MLSEKLVTAIDSGMANTRVRDFADIHLLTGRQAFSRACCATLFLRQQNFGYLLDSAGDCYAGLGQLRDATYVAYRNRLGEAGASLPERFDDAVSAAGDLVDPVLNGLPADFIWNPTVRTWTTSRA